MSIYVITRAISLAWDSNKPFREQAGWEEHAAFMDQLLAEGFIKLGGPLDGGLEVLLVVEAPNAQTALARLSADPWEKARLLKTRGVSQWDVTLNGYRSSESKA